MPHVVISVLIIKSQLKLERSALDESANHSQVDDPDLAAKLNLLFETMHADGVKPDSNEKVVAALALIDKNARITSQYLGQIRAGKKTKINAHTLRALAKYFNVSASYLIEPGPNKDIEKQLSLMRLMRDEKVRSIAMRVSGLSDQSVTSVEALLEQLRALERLPPVESPPSERT